ncbi:MULTISPECIES: imidazolonepropionase [Petrotoga]|uniref:Imidazolonepropionase n=2 Tax=Petrotoga sibirica TaxID=156202 RepID=A0A4R8EEU8_9BACT|nr:MULTISPECIES: imidazolonepropionase [Petrotoga]POZ89216.1 imidazolonepropionase [Petrotoga sibirica DSM 13575]POZ91681.1 imidazolonepropionase [Petrotoga sp. SL27]TDX09959.1 imidazolonepropionase [Petrotoga sibirica]
METNMSEKATLVIKNISNLITMKGPNRPRKKEEMSEIGLIKNGIIAASKDKIIYVGSGDLPKDIEISQDAKIINAQGKTVTPGLIDPHTHLVHGGSREYELFKKLKGESYLDILSSGGGIYDTVESTKKTSFEELLKKAEKSLNRMLSYGVTTVEAKSGYGLDDFDTELKQLEVIRELNRIHPVDLVPTFLGAHAVPKKYEGNVDKFVDILIREMIPYVAEKDLAKFCDIFCEKGVFLVDQSRKILSAAKEHGLFLKIHADEIEPLGGAELAAELGCISADHLVGASDEGLKKMAKSNVIATLLPTTTFFLQSEKYANARKMIDLGIPIALSTDYNPGSSPTENLQLVMTFGALKLHMNPKEIITSVTINAACALKLEDKIGSLEVGKKADITIFDVPNIEYLIYHFGVNHTQTVIKNGEVYDIAAVS